MILELLEQEDFEDLPEEAGPRWVALENLARQRLHRALTDESSSRTDKYLKLQYMQTVIAAAHELGIEGIQLPGGTDPSAQLDHFMIGAQAAATRIWINASGKDGLFSLKIRTSAKTKIRELVSEILKTVPKLKLDKNREKRLRESLQNFSDELEAPRARFSVGSTQLVIALTVVNLAVTTTAAGPDALDAILQIQSIWGEEHERSTSEKLRVAYEEPKGLLEAPIKQIEGPKNNSKEE